MQQWSILNWLMLLQALTLQFTLHLTLPKHLIPFPVKPAGHGPHSAPTPGAGIS